MGKYDRLHVHLRRQKAPSYEMSVSHIEGVIGAMLPKSAQRPDWWAEDPDPAGCSIQCKAWLSAGYTATLLKDGEHVRFDNGVKRRP